MPRKSLPTAPCPTGHDDYVGEKIWRNSSSPTSYWTPTSHNQNIRHCSAACSRPLAAGPRSSVPSLVLRTQGANCLGRRLLHQYPLPKKPCADHLDEETERTGHRFHRPSVEGRRPQQVYVLSGDGITTCGSPRTARDSVTFCSSVYISDNSRSETARVVCSLRRNQFAAMSELGRTRATGEDNDLRCGEVSALGASTSFSREHWVEPSGPRCGNNQEQTVEEFLAALLLKTDTYRPRQEGVKCMGNRAFLHMRAAVVNWFSSVSESYKFSNETILTAVCNFDRYVALRVEAVDDHLLLQLAAYVALLVASKMTETIPLRMKSLANLTGRMFTPRQVQRCEMDMLCKLQFRLAPPSANEILLCLSALIHKPWPSGVSMRNVQSMGSYFLKKARVRTCWFRHSPYTLAVAALATAFKSLGLGQLRRRLLRECDARARRVKGRGIDIRGVVFCAEAMANDERAAAAAVALAARGGNGSPAPINSDQKVGWGSPTGVAHGAEVLRDMTISMVATDPYPRPMAPPLLPKSVGPPAFPKPARVQGAPVSNALTVSAPTVSVSVTRGQGQQFGKKRGLPQSFGSCFEPRRRRASVCGLVGRIAQVDAAQALAVARGTQEGQLEDGVSYVSWNQQS